MNEVYYPRIDQANTRDMESLVPDGYRYFSEEKRDTNRRIAPVVRYQTKKISSKLVAWRFDQKIRTIPHGRNLRIEVLVPATIHWNNGNWKNGDRFENC